MQRARVGRQGGVMGDGLVRREWLFDRFFAGRGGVTLVCAPAGSGKTVLVRSWIDAAQLHERAGWVSVDRDERDPQRFWLAVVDALAGAVAVVDRVGVVPSFRGDVVVDQLLGDLERMSEPAVLVIDDLHELGSADALTGLERFLARLPSALRVVLVTREDPDLGLHRLRLSGALTEVRAADLRFSEPETKELLRAAGIALSDCGAELLYERTEGWAAGLRLAVMSLAQHPDPERFVREFSGTERTVAGYLLAEVLERRPADVRELLLRTSVLERVSGPLADHLTGGSGSERILQELEDANAFVTALDVGRSWFRYHRLFADLLRLELRRTAPAIVDSLHRAAAAWHEREGDIVEAIRHAQAGRDWSLAARLLADHHLALTFDGGTGTVRQLLGAFAPDAPAADPELALVFATVRLLDGALDESAAYLDVAERLSDMVPGERRGRFDLPLALVTLALARWRGDLDAVLGAMRSAEAALAAQPPSAGALGHELRAVALLNLGVAELWSSRPRAGRRDLEQALQLARRAGRPWLEIAALGHLGIAGPWTGLAFSAAFELGEEAVRIAEAHGWGKDPIVVTALAAGAIALLWLGRLDEAEQRIERAGRTLYPGGEPATELIVDYARGLLCLAQERLDEALVAFQAAERMQALLAGEHAFAVAVRARLVQTQAHMGRTAAAAAALAAIGPQERDTSDMRVVEAVVELAEGEPERAAGVLASALERVEPTIHGPAVTVEAQLLDAVARERLGDHQAAEASLERALDRAEPEGILLPFLLVGVEDILARMPRHRTAHAALAQTILDLLAGVAPRPGGGAVGLREELSEAELRVVRYLPSNLKASEIAAELFVSTNTVRTHLRHIYSKLDAHGRAEAVARARELRLLAPSARGR